MGLPDEYVLPENYNDAYGLMGDGVVVPVVRFLAEHILEPILGMAHANRGDTDADARNLWFELHEDDAREWSHEEAMAQ